MPDINHHDALSKLAQHMEELPGDYLHFDMENYFHDPRAKLATEQDEMVHSIDLIRPVHGMCGCLLGHSAAAGIAPNPIAHDDWAAFAKDAFGVEGEAFGYLFGGEWYPRDNTTVGAAQRIRTYLASGVPDGWQNDEEPACA